VRRDQMAAFVFRALEAGGVDLPPPGEGFTDVPAGSAHDEAVRRLAAAGIVQGGPGHLDDGAFGPSFPVRRDQMASMLLRAAEYAADTDLASDQEAFSDVPPGNAHFANVNGAAQHGLAAGYLDGSYRPGASVRRDQTASFAVRLLGWLGGDVEVSVFFSGPDSDQTGEVFPLPRTVPVAGVLRATMDALLEGPTAAERAHDYWSWFSEDTAGMVRIVSVSDRTAYVDFDDFSEIIPNASTAAGSLVLLSQLDATATQFPTVDRARYSFEGDQAAFYNWLQLSPPD
ncbi:MAG: S-layer homology domain-containing protein, partial [Egibacteraceae bacterium]